MEEKSGQALANPSHGVEERNRVMDEEASLKLEKDSGVHFDKMYFEHCLIDGKWDEAEKYLSGFLKIDQDKVSLEIFYDIRKHNYFEALDRKDYSKAVEILKKDLKFFARYNEDLFKETTMLLTLDDFREIIKLSNHGDTKSARANLLNVLKPKIEKCTFLCCKHGFCDSVNSKLTASVYQSCGNNPMADPLVGPGGSYVPIPAPAPPMMPIMPIQNWDHIASYSIPNPLTGSTNTIPAPALPVMPLQNSNPIPAPAPPIMPMKLTQNWDHIASYSIPNPLTGFNTTIPAPALPMMPMQNSELLSASFCTPNHSVSSNCTSHFQPASTPCRAPMPYTSSVPHQAVSSQSYDLNAPVFQVPETPLKRRKLAGTAVKVNDSPVGVLPGTNLDALPQTAVVNFYPGSKVQSLDFHPVQQTLLLVGTANGDISIWDMGGTTWLFCESFKIWDIEACLSFVKASFASDSTAAVNRVIWSSDGAFFGVAYSKHLVHIYSYSGDDLRRYMEINAHFGNVYDISFSHQSTSLCIITCGEDNAIRMWMADGGNRFSQVYKFVGHEAPVYSLCPNEDGKQYLFSVDTKGKINAWIYGTRLFTCDACPSRGRMACSADGRRLFFCGTDSNGDPFLVEWDHKNGGEVKRTYQGLQRGSADVVQFDTANNQILAAGDEFRVKFWSMDSVKQLSHTFAAGGLPFRPCIRFNKGGTLLGVSTLENGVRVLANAGGLQLLSSVEKCPLPSMRFATAMHDKIVGGSPGFNSVKQQSRGFSSSERQIPDFSPGNSVY